MGEFVPSLGSGECSEGRADEMEETFTFGKRFTCLLQFQVFGTGVVDNDLDDRILQLAGYTGKVGDPPEIELVTANTIESKQLLHFTLESVVKAHVLVEVIKDKCLVEIASVDSA